MLLVTYAHPDKVVLDLRYIEDGCLCFKSGDWNLRIFLTNLPPRVAAKLREAMTSLEPADFDIENSAASA